MATSPSYTVAPPGPALAGPTIAAAATPEEQFLEQAFASFTEAAKILERSYTQLQTEVARLRRELEGTNQELECSLEENRRSRRHLHWILEGLPCGVLVCEGDKLSMVNPEARRFLGTMATPARREQLPAWLRSLLERVECGPREKPASEHIYPCRAEGIEWIAVRRAVLPEETEKSGSIFILRDVTQARRLEEMQELLQRRQALEELSAVLAHEVRNPLGSLELFTGLLTESALDNQSKYWVGHLQTGLRRLAATVNNVLQFHSGPAPELAPRALGPVLTTIGDFLRAQAQRARVYLELDHQLDDVYVAMDQHRLEQVLLNLALNGLRSMPEGGVLQITGTIWKNTGKDPQKEPAVARLEIRDTGTGITAQDLPHIFEPGFTTTPGSPGLGLAVCKMIVEQHHGTIAVSSLPEIGTAFVVELPVVEER